MVMRSPPILPPHGRAGSRPRGSRCRSSGRARPAPGRRRRSRAAQATRGARSAPAPRSPTPRGCARSRAGRSRKRHRPARIRPATTRTRSSVASRAGSARSRKRRPSGPPNRYFANGSSSLRRRSATRAGAEAAEARAPGRDAQSGDVREVVAIVADEPENTRRATGNGQPRHEGGEALRASRFAGGAPSERTTKGYGRWRPRLRCPPAALAGVSLAHAGPPSRLLRDPVASPGAPAPGVRRRTCE